MTLDEEKIKEYDMFDIKYCVYFLCQDNKVIYVGRTAYLMSRIKTHHAKGIPFNKIYYAEYSSYEDHVLAEEMFIKKYNPPYNTPINKFVCQNCSRPLQITYNGFTHAKGYKGIKNSPHKIVPILDGETIRYKNKNEIQYERDNQLLTLPKSIISKKIKMGLDYEDTTWTPDTKFKTGSQD